MHTGGSSSNSNKGGSGSTAGGSLWLSELGWRDMWAMVAKHQNDNPEADRGGTRSAGGHVYGESYSRNSGIVPYNSKSSSTSSWGTDVMLRVQVPLDHSQNNQSE